MGLRRWLVWVWQHLPFVRRRGGPELAGGGGARQPPPPLPPARRPERGGGGGAETPPAPVPAAAGHGGGTRGVRGGHSDQIPAPAVAPVEGPVAGAGARRT